VFSVLYLFMRSKSCSCDVEEQLGECAVWVVVGAGFTDLAGPVEKLPSGKVATASRGNSSSLRSAAYPKRVGSEKVTHCSSTSCSRVQYYGGQVLVERKRAVLESYHEGLHPLGTQRRGGGGSASA